MKPIETAIIRIFTTDGSIVGLGFLITESRIMTCAHVVADAVGIERDDPNPPSYAIAVDFPLVDDNKKCTASLVVWLPSRDGTDDIAVLELNEAAPVSVKPANLVTVDKLWGAEFGVYGFPRYNPKGVWAKGKVSGLIEGKRIQIDAMEGNISYFIEPGFSGSPVYSNDPNINGVIGMAVSAESDPNIKAGFMIPSDVLLAKMNQRQPLPQSTDDVQTSPLRTPINMTDGKPQPVSSYTREGRPRVVYIGEFAEIKPAKRSKTVFIAHSFFGGDSAQMQDYRIFLKEGLTQVGYQPVFSGNASGTLLKTICKEIIDTEAGIFDVSGYNANVLIELGMSIGLNQPTIVIAQDDRKPLIDSLQQLNPLRYTDAYDLAEGIGQALKEQIQRYHQSGTSPRFCAACGLDCVARKHVSSPDYCYLIAGAHPENDKGIFFHLKKVAKNFRDHTGQALQFLQVEGDFNLTVCQWVEEIKRSKIVFFHSKENGDKRHSGSDNAATMVRTGIAIGLGVAWRMILKQGDEMPTDLKGYQRVIWQSSATAFDVELNGAVRTLLSEARPYGGMYDPLIPVEAVEDADDNGLIVQDTSSKRGNLFVLPEVSDTIFQEIEADIRAVQDLLASSKVVVVQGIGGSGKTTLVAALGRDEKTVAKYKDGILGFYPRQIRDESSMAEALSTIAAQLNSDVEITPDFTKAKNLLEQELIGKTCLIIADGIDEVPNQFGIQAVVSAFALLEKTDSDLLITSRVSIGDVNWTIPSIYTLNAFVQEVVIWYVAEDARAHAEGISGKLRDVNVSTQLLEFETLIYADGVQQLEKAVSTGAPFILLISPEIHKFRQELQLLMSQHVNVLSVLVETTEIPDDLKQIKYIDFHVESDQPIVQILNWLRSTKNPSKNILAQANERESILNDLLLSWFTDISSREAILSDAFLDTNLLSIIDVSGSNRVFVARLINQLVQYGEVKPGKQAIIQLLESLESRAGEDSQRVIREIITQYEQENLVTEKASVQQKFSDENLQRTRKLFLAYSSIDAAKVDKVATDLSQFKFDNGTQRFTMWQDKHNLLPGTNWWDAIVDAIVNCDVFVFFVSESSLKSQSCLAEVEYARKRNRPIIPIVLEGEFFLNPNSGQYDISYWNIVPEWLHNMQFLFYTGADFYSRFQTAIEMFERNWPQDIDAPLPVSPYYNQQSDELDRKDVYISSTLRDLADHLQAVQDAILRLGMSPMMMENFSASNQDALTASLEMVKRSDIHIVILGHRYGYIPDDARNPDRLSIVELEYNEAVRLGNPIIAFIMDDQHPVPSSVIESNEESSRALREFKKRLMQRQVNFFTSPDDLQAKVLAALRNPQLRKRSSTPTVSQQTAKSIVKVFLSGPGDVHAEIEIARQTIDKLSKDFSVGIDVQNPSDAGQLYSSPQDMINRGSPKPSECDIVIAIFWSRMGTPLVVDGKEYLSGTHWELMDALSSSHPETIIFRRTEQLQIDATDPHIASKIEQYRKVEEFFNSDLFYKDGMILRGINQYKTPDDFQRDFEMFFNELLTRLLEKYDNQ